MKKFAGLVLVFISICCIAATDLKCDNSNEVSKASSGVSRVSTNVSTQADGKTLEQSNVEKRLLLENKPGAIQHLYILSAYSGQVILYSTVRGKVTSSGKRLSPTQRAISGYSEDYHPELLGDDGTYGTSVDYLYWWDVQGRYHQQYVSGGLFVHISDQPMQFGRVTLQVESSKESK
jgi:hypothetical protein